MKKDKKILIMKDGKKFTVIDENDKYYICEKTQFKKSNKAIADIEIKKAKEKKEEPEEEIIEEVETETEGA